MVIKQYNHIQLNTILEQFTVPKVQYTFQSLTNGFVNDTYLVLKLGEPIYILQRIHQEVFDSIESLMLNIDQSLKKLKGNQYEKISLIATSTGKNYLPANSKYWRLYSYVSNSVSFQTTTSTDIAFETGKIIGEFHALLNHVDVTKYSETTYKFHDLEFRKLQFLSAEARASSEKLLLAKEPISYVYSMFKKLEAMAKENGQLPMRICHNDARLNNILFCEKTKKALCLIDLDTIMPGYFHYDFGNAVYTIINSENEKSTFNETLFEAFTNGISQHKGILNKEECAALPYGVVLMPFLYGLRILTDYLNNKTPQKNQNFNKCHNLFGFSQEAEEKRDYIHAIINKTLLC